MTPVTISSLAIIVFAALIHASFQLSVSVLTLLSGHSLGKKLAHRRMLHLMHHFINGVALFTVLLTSSLVYYFGSIINHSAQFETLVAAVISGLLVGLGLATWAFYYRRGPGTTLWLPRGFAAYLTKRSRITKSATEALGLGMMSVVAELLFIIAPLSAAALAIVSLPDLWWQLAGVALYVVVSLLSLFIVFMLAGGGHTVSRLQTWRERHKRFLQFVAGGSMIILAAYLFVDRVIGISLYGVFS